MTKVIVTPCFNPNKDVTAIKTDRFEYLCSIGKIDEYTGYSKKVKATSAPVAKEMFLRNLRLEYVNNFISVAGFSEHYRLNSEAVKAVMRAVI